MGAYVVPREQPQAAFTSLLDVESGNSCSGALVIGANYRALGVVRGLGRRGIPVWVLKDRSEILAAVSRYAQCVLDWPTGSDPEIAAHLVALAEEHGIRGWLLIPTDDEAARLIAQNYELLRASFSLGTSEWEVQKWAYDKRLTYSLCASIGVAIPRTLCGGSREEVAALDWPFPVIIKPAFKPQLNRLTASKAWLVQSHQSLMTAYDEACTLADPATLLIQEVIPGRGGSQFSYVALVKSGKPLAWLVARRVRQIPMEFGRFSTYVETIDDLDVVTPACRFLSAIDYTGLVEVEFKRDERDGVCKLLDVNARIWGWYTLCARAGVDFSYLLWRMVRGEDISPVRGKSGVGWMRFASDLPIAVQSILTGRLRTAAYLREMRRSPEEAIFAVDDPFPGLVELPHLVFKLGTRWLREWSLGARRNEGAANAETVMPGAGKQ
jgi:D-aspartate ligase